jgi:hypothetical protein
MRGCALVLIGLVACCAPARAEDEIDRAGKRVQDCVTAAAAAHRLPPTVLVILLRVEGGALGRVSRNRNGSADIGPMQVNDRWLPALARHWHAPASAAYGSLRDDFCANVEGGAWILRQAVDEAHGDFWEGVARYHSHDPAAKSAYLRRMLREALSLAAAAGPATAPARLAKE